MSYNLQFSSNFDKQLKKIHPQDAKRAVKEIETLQTNPFPKGKKVKHLIGTKAWRLRVSKVRIIFFVNEKDRTIYIEDVAYRKDIY
ncbi:hypothetical protein A2165_01800 [Candidatus Curtissbacteria bacterium RBG_13_40_7]|uniref:Plasmid stabilization protein n=1 Tax=Candidatus Curtissbacteria bacterium RBG_13_40_7 TaxID=1797706 RepID=A0A1F5FWS5_9BACT|nr:MAG: hypothetical protein A2165_01800 [Candidatus Curtissbacteria bacterium RBG_13_40_7]